MPPKEALPKAKEAVNRALALNESLAEAHRAIGCYHPGKIFPVGKPLATKGVFMAETSLSLQRDVESYANPLPVGRRVAYSVDPVTARAGPLLKSGIPAWASPFCRNFPRRQNSS